jgi:hypothetical protein
MGSDPIPSGGVTALTVNSGNTPLTLTTAQLLTGTLIVNCDDTGTLTLPTATLIMAGCPGLSIGSKLRVEIINHGDQTLTVAVGTGITNKVLTSGSGTVTSVLTMTTLVSKRFLLVCTGLANPSDPTTSNTFDLYAYGSLAAAVA